MAVTLLGMGEINSEIRQALTVHREPSLMLDQLMLENGALEGKPVDRNPPEASRSYSSVCDNHAIGTGSARSMLSSEKAWKAQHNNQDQWMVIDTGNQTLVVGVIVQGRGRSHQGQKVTRVAVSVGNAQDGPWTECGEYDCHTSNEHEQRRVMLNQPTAGRYVRLNPRSWEQHISMRAGVIISQLRKISLLEQLMLDSKCAKLVETLCADAEIKDAALLAALKPETVNVGVGSVITWIEGCRMPRSVYGRKRVGYRYAPSLQPLLDPHV